MEPEFTIEEVITLMRKTKKTDPLFKPLKKLKTAVEGVGITAISFVPTNKIFVFHFGLGNQIDREFINLSKPIDLANKITIIPGHSYSILHFINVQSSSWFMQSKIKINQKPVYYQELQYQNLCRTLIFLYCKQDFLKQTQTSQVPNCSSSYEQLSIPGLLVYQNIMTHQEEVQILQKIDEGNWERLNNRRVQHYGYKFKYGRNQIDKDQKQGILPNFFAQLLARLSEIDILKDTIFDQLTINDYFAGNGIPSHFDTHSPFQQIFISVSLLSGIVMQFKKFDGQQRSIYLKQRSVAIFSGQVRYAWSHGISCRKIDKVDNQIYHRSRRVSLTFRKIKFTICKCPYYFYCDSQGYDQQTMKKNNPLLTKYMSEQHLGVICKLNPKQIEKQYVQKAYNGFGFDFHNKVIEQIKVYMQKQFQNGEFVLDLGCGNGQYKKYTNKQSFYFSVQKCTTMLAVEDQIYMDCLRLNFRQSVFDRVLLIAVLHHFASRQTRVKALVEINKIMKDGGTLYLTVLNYQNKADVYASSQTFLEYCLPSNKIQLKTKLSKQTQMQIPRLQSRGEIYKRYYHLFTTKQISELLTQANFNILQLTTNKQNIVVKAQKFKK